MAELMFKLSTGRSARVTRVEPRAPETVATYGIRYADNGEPIGYPLVTEAEPLVPWIEQATGSTVVGAVEGTQVVPIKRLNI